MRGTTCRTPHRAAAGSTPPREPENKQNSARIVCIVFSCVLLVTSTPSCEQASARPDVGPGQTVGIPGHQQVSLRSEYYVPTQ